MLSQEAEPAECVDPYPLQALRAPLITTVLGGYKDVSRQSWKEELPHIWPYLAHLIFSPQPSVRTALASLLMTQLPAMLHGL